MGGFALAVSVLSKLGKFSVVKYSVVWKTNAGAVGVIGKADGPTAVFVASKAAPLVFPNVFIRFFSCASAFSAAQLAHRARQKKRHEI